MSELGFAIIGTGMVARYHAEAIRRTAGARLVAVHRADAARAAEAADHFEVPCEVSFDELLHRSDVDVVCICTPSGLHAEQTIMAARAGKHVLVEKPMALSLEDADAAIAACDDAGVQFGVALQRRVDPVFSAVRAAIQAGHLGNMVLGSVTIPYVRPQAYYDSAAWRGTWALDGGGALMNQGIHLLDLLLWFMGDVAEVQARTATLAHRIEVEDCASATLRFANGALGTIAATTAAAPGFPHRIEIYGDQGGIQIEGERVVRVGGDTPDLARAVPVAAAADAQDPIPAGAGASPTGIGAEGHTRIIADFVASIANGHSPIVPGQEGRRALALVLAIYEAARTGRAVIPG
jgi:UDP-N-acetyl-2-amino-2-deoxyglucuronate dehydrogenase